MTVYRAFGVLIESDLPLPEVPALTEINGDPVAHTFRLLPAHRSAIREYDWVHQWEQDDGSVWFACARHCGQHILRFPGWADFFIKDAGRLIDCIPWPGIPPETIRHLFLDQVFPRILSQRDGVVLHGAAVVIEGGAVVFMGASGCGKSTLATGFSRLGFPLLTDDGLYVAEQAGQLVCYPSYPGMRLWPEALATFYDGSAKVPTVAHFTSKQRLNMGLGGLQFASTPAPLHSLYLLGDALYDTPDEQVEIATMAAKDIFREVARGLHRLDVTDRRELQHQFEFVTKLAAKAPAHHLTFPHDFARLAHVLETVRAHLRGQYAGVRGKGELDSYAIAD